MKGDCMGKLLSFPRAPIRNETRFEKIFFEIFFSIYAFGPIAFLVGILLQNMPLLKAGTICFIITHLILIVAYYFADPGTGKRKEQRLPTHGPA